MVNSTHSVKLKSAPKIGLHSSSRNMKDSQATPATSGTNEDEKPFKETAKKNLSEKNDEGESLFDLIRNIVQEELKVHERLHKLSAEIVDSTASLEFTGKKLTRNYSR